jgi:hypothetical protein
VTGAWQGFGCLDRSSCWLVRDGLHG